MPINQLPPFYRREHFGLLFVLATYVVAALWLALRLPAAVSPNDTMHYEVVVLIRRNGALPNPLESPGMDERDQPPLYYALAALASWPFSAAEIKSAFPGNPYYLATHHGNLNGSVPSALDNLSVLYTSRFVAVVFGLLGLIGMWLAARATLPVDVSLLVVGLVAFHPGYFYFATSLSNDGPATAMVALVLACSTYLLVLKQPPRAAVGWGLLFGLAMITKANAVATLPALILVGLTQGFWQKSWMVSVYTVLWGMAGALPFWGSWLFFNHWRGLDAMALKDSVPVEKLIHLNGYNFAQLLPFLMSFWRTFWLDWSNGEKGFAPEWLYAVAFGFLLVTTIGWFIPRASLRQPMQLVLLHAGVSIGILILYFSAKALLYKEMGRMIPEGRWLLPLLPSLAWLMGVGWAHWWRAAWRPWASYGLLLAYGSLLIGLLIFLIPTLYPQLAVLAADEPLPAQAQPANLQYGAELLLEASLAPTMTIGQLSSVDLFWRALRPMHKDYTLSLQLLVQQGDTLLKLDEQNSYPALGSAPTSRWQAGTRYRDRFYLQPMGKLNGPTQALLALWVLNDSQGGALLAATQTNTPNAQPVEVPLLQRLVVYPDYALLPPAAAQLATPVSFGDPAGDPTKFIGQLTGVNVERTSGAATVQLWWQAQQAGGTQYTVFVQWLNPAGKVIAQADGVPNQGQSPTNIWRPGDTVLDVHPFAPSAAFAPTPTGIFPGGTLLIGLYDPQSGERLMATQGGVALPNNALALPSTRLRLK